MKCNDHKNAELGKKLLGLDPVIVHISQQRGPDIPVSHDERILMSEAGQREIAETLFERAHSREEIKDAIRLEEERRATLVKNLYRLRALRMSRTTAANQCPKSRAVLEPNLCGRRKPQVSRRIR